MILNIWIFLTEGDEIVEGLSKMTHSKQMVTKDGTVIDVSPEGKGVDEAFQKKIYKDVEGEGQIIPEPENAGIDHQGNVYGEETIFRNYWRRGS